MRHILGLLVYLVAGAGALYVLKGAGGRTPSVGDLLDPVEGLYYNARTAMHPSEAAWTIEGLKGAVQIVRDERGVPHIFAEHDLDGITALGFVVAQDRLFQLDFVPRVAAGRLAEILGPAALSTDRFLRRTGMEWGARKNLARINRQHGVEKALIEAYVRGVNAYIDALAPKDWPFEFKLLGYAPERYTPLHVLRILQYMTYDLTYRTDDPIYRELAASLGAEAYEALYPRFARLYVPIIPEPGGRMVAGAERPVFAANGPEKTDVRSLPAGTPWEGYVEGKGSNNWAVASEKSATGAPILAGDMHLSLWLPSIWYEVHLVTPSMNTYGVTIPGAPLPVEGYNDVLGWAYTNTGSDQIDHYALSVDESGRRYRYQGEFVPFEEVPDTNFVKGTEPVVDTLRYSRWGPVVQSAGSTIALRWVAHDSSRTLRAQWEMNRARTMEEFQEALRLWDTPMQNILYADVRGNIAIRSTGYLPVRRGGHGIGVLDGSTDAHAWIGRVPFEDLPHSYNPAQHFLTSTNQQPADSTYPYYLGHNWPPGYRSLRIDTLLRGKDRHTVDDMRRYQADVHAVQWDLFVPLLDTLGGLTGRAGELRDMLVRWDGNAGVERPEPLVLDIYLNTLNAIVWDEPIFQRMKPPNEERLLALLSGEISPHWLDQVTTAAVEDAGDVMRLALAVTADSLSQRYGPDPAGWRWGNHHHVVFRHFTRSDALKALWRGPYEYPGFAATLSPARGRMTTHSASWRMVVDFSQAPPAGYGVYPGGQSGNPFSPLYDAHIERYLRFELYPLLNPARLADMPPEHIASRLALRAR